MFLQFANLVREKSGLELPAARRPDLEHFVSEVMQGQSIASPAQLYHLLAGGGAPAGLLDELVEHLTIGETHFFRNQPQFEALQNVILPEIIARKRPVHSLRLWSAGCASGEEPYSLAMLLTRLLPDLDEWHIQLLGTDLNRRFLQKAARGLYGAWSFREMPAGLKADFFEASGRQFELDARIRRMVTFRTLNLVRDDFSLLGSETAGMDLILCRNVLIYFNSDNIRRVVGRFYEALSPQGWLVVGPAEPSQEVFHQFSVHNLPGAVIYQKTPPALPSVPGKLRAVPTLSASIQSPRQAAPRPAPVSLPVPARLRLQSLPPISPAAEAALRLGDSSAALDSLQALAQSDPADPWPPFLLARLYAAGLDLRAAETWVDRLLRDEPLLAPAHYLRGLILQEAGRAEASLEAFRACIYADPGFALGHFALAAALQSLSQIQRASKELENVERLLRGRNPSEPLPEGDGLTAGALLRMVAAQKEHLQP